MSVGSIRAKLTIWYLAALTLVTVSVAAGSYVLMRHSLLASADAALSARVESVSQFIETMEQSLGETEMRDEIREYAELTLGRAYLEVAEVGGVIVYKPSISGWDALRNPVATTPRPVSLDDRTLAGEPVRVADAVVTIRQHTYHIVGALPMAPAYDALSRFRWLLLGLVPAVLVVAGLGGYAISRRALAPVDRMTRSASAITLQHLDRRLDVPRSDDELTRLAVTFNDMLARLQSAVAEMTRLTAEASHELRTPVALIRATAEVAVGRERSAADYRQALVEVSDHAARLSKLVDDLLSLARSDAGVEPSERAPVDLVNLVREAGDGMRAAITMAGLTCVVETAGPAGVVGNHDALRRLLVILLDNAVKYTPSGGEVGVALTSSSNGADRVVEIAVTDTGIGVDAADRPRVFDRFFRGSAARARVSDGSGLGLAIARTIVDRHAGSIEVTDGPNGRGCRVCVRLPYDGQAV